MDSTDHFRYRYRHWVNALCLVVSVVGALLLLQVRSTTNLAPQQIILYLIPLSMSIGLVSGWQPAWRDILVSMACVYLFTPFLAARIEACLLPIPGSVPCFADLQQVRTVSNQLNHQFYYGALIGIHILGSIVVWYTTYRQEGAHVTSSSRS